MNRRLIIVSVIGALGGLLFGFDTAVINGAMPFFKAHFELSDVMLGWAVSSALVGCIIGAIMIGRPCDKHGRRQMLKVMALLFLISALVTGFAPSISIFIMGRFIGGIAVGGASVVSPMYISEISPAKYRGRLTVTFQLAIVIGILLAFFVDYLLIDTGENNWRFMFLSMGIPAVTFFILLFFVGRSPRWLVQKNKLDEALKVIVTVNDSADSKLILNDIVNSIENEKETKSVSITKKPYKKLLFIGIMAAFFSQFTGINVVMYYATDIFREVGFSTNSAIGQTVVIGFTNLIFTILALFLIDRIGRKKLLLFGTLGMTIFLGLFSISFFYGFMGGYVTLLILIIYAGFFAVSAGAVVWVLLAEIFPNSLRSRGMSIASFAIWVSAGTISFLFPVVNGLFTEGKGLGYIFAFFSLVTFASFFFYKKFLFETKSKTLEQIESELKNN